MRGKARKAGFFILMVAMTLVICFVILEFVFARFYYSDVYQTSRVKFDPVVGWRLKPGEYMVKPKDSFTKHEVYVNALGLRNRDIPEVRDEGVTRVLILGDSFTYGGTNPSKTIFPVLLEQILNQHSTQPKFEVINAGVPGFSTAQELLLMEELAKENVTADIYLVMAFPNDILEDARLFCSDMTVNRSSPAFVLDGQGRLVLEYLPEEGGRRAPEPDSPKKLRSLSRTKIIGVLRHRLGSYIQTKPGLLRFFNKLGFKVEFPRMPALIAGWYDQEILSQGVPLMSALLAELKRQAQADGGKLVVCYIPSELQVYPDVYVPLVKRTFPGSPQVAEWLEDQTRPQRIVGEICRTQDTPFLDLLPVMQQNNTKTLYIAADGHFNKTGHALVASVLADLVREQAD
jgi:lysophospholipase L1-like esterase